MSQVAGSGRTVLFVSHNVNAIEELCSSILWLEKGRVKPVNAGDVRAAISEYMFGTESDRQARWVNAEGQFKNPHFCPLEFAVTDRTGNVLPQPMRNDVEAFIRIRAEIQTVEPTLTVGYAVYDEQGETLFWSYQTDTDESRWPKLEPGIHTLCAPFPRRLLNEGSYRIELIGGLHRREWYFQPGVSAPSMYVTIQGGLSESPYWMERRAGILAPVIEWQVL
jgi:lipopolysaccharide transport system ATP-binding protein